MKLIEKNFLYLRHGETDWNHNRIAMGQTDIELNATGLEQAHQAAEVIAKHIDEIDLICSSPLKRAKHTAEIVAEKINREIIEIPELMEINLGINQGRSFLDGNWMNEWEAGVAVEGAETHDQFVSRFVSGINQAIDRPERVLIVSHGLAFIQLSRILMDQVVFLPNCSPIRCVSSNNFFKMEVLS